MLASDVFRGSPQLAAFLRYVIEATLRGEADRIKGYTIAIEALGRGAAFDPQADPIVRVEAARLRRAINRYYASAPVPETVLIELPRGSYVPVFRRMPALPRLGRRTRLSAAGLAWKHVPIGVALVLSGAAAYALLDFRYDFNTPAQPGPTVTSSVPAETARRQSVLPVVVVEPFEPVTARATTAPLARALRDRLRDALARFDEIQVAAEPARTSNERDSPGAVQASYRVAGSLGTYDDGTLTLRVRLTDASDGSVAYTRTFDRLMWAADPSTTEDAIVRELSAVLAQPYGIIHADERSKSAGNARDQRYRCLMQAYDYWRDYDLAVHARARDCLERAIEADPTFAIGFAALAPLVLEEYIDGVNIRPQDAPPLQRALQYARRAVELKPASARAHQALLDVLFARGDYNVALEAGEKAMMLNPYDPDIMADYGARVLSLGERDRGARLLEAAATSIVARPAWHETFLFLSAYLAGDASTAARHAAMIASENYPLGLVALVLAAAGGNDRDQSRRLIDRLTTLQPGWRGDPRQELRKLIPAESIVERLATDLARAGLGAVN